jgi:hypothetical protein
MYRKIGISSPAKPMRRRASKEPEDATVWMMVVSRLPGGPLLPLIRVWKSRHSFVTGQAYPVRFLSSRTRESR